MTAQCERDASAVSFWEARLKPCGARSGSLHLTACLALVAPTGMTEEERAAWLAIARDTLKGIPGDLLERGALYARQYADHPSKIVPAIMRHVGAEWEGRKRELQRAKRTMGETLALPAPKPEAVCREVTQRILREVAQGMERQGE